LQRIQGFEEAKLRADSWFARLTFTAFAERIPSPWSHRSRTEPGRIRRRALAVHLNHLHTVALLIFSCNLFLAVTGCGGSVTVEHPSGTLAASPSTVAFGNITVGQAAHSTITFRAGSSGSVQITAFGVSGQGFALSGQPALPITIAAGGTYDLNVQFSPDATGPAAGQITATSTSSTDGTVVVALNGAGASAPASASVSAFSCTSASITGPGTDACTVTLNAAAGKGGLAVSLSSGSSAVTVPATLTVDAGATSATFTATVSSVTTAQAVTLEASAGNVSRTFALQLNVTVPTLSINATSIGFGNVALNTPATQTLILSSIGTAPVTVNSAVLAGVGFTLSGPTFPETLSPGQTATLGVEFDPTALGAAAGVLTIVSTSSTNGTAAIAVTGTGASSTGYVVNLSWDAPTDSTVPVAGYNIYRSPDGGSSYQLLNPTVDGQTTYVDSKVQDGLSYDYIVESVDASGVQSVPTSPVLVTIP
jgi:hypothetical protein